MFLGALVVHWECELIRIVLAVCILLCGAGMSHAETPTAASANNDPLFQTIAGQDTRLFSAIDRCDMAIVASMWAEDAEFYHDKTGLMTGRKNIVDSIRNNLCGKVKRQLVPGTLEVYPMQGYGAVEIGIHRFYHPGEKDHDIAMTIKCKEVQMSGLLNPREPIRHSKKVISGACSEE